MTTCNKDTGSKRRVQKWTRGVWFCVSGGGHIQMWQPLYQYDCLHNSIIMHEFWMHCLIIQHRSEGPAQVFLRLLTWLIAASGRKSREDWKKITVSYDSMCHLNNLKVARQPLPLPGDLAYLWLDMKKIVDDLHIKNHLHPRCEQYRTPADIGNIIVCEQTFA